LRKKEHVKKKVAGQRHRQDVDGPGTEEHGKTKTE